MNNIAVLMLLSTEIPLETILGRYDSRSLQSLHVAFLILSGPYQRFEVRPRTIVVIVPDNSMGSEALITFQNSQYITQSKWP